MYEKFTNLVKNNPLFKYGLIIIVLPIAAVVTLLQGGSIGDIFSQKVNDRELRVLVKNRVNDNQSRYGFRVSTASDVQCDGSLKNELNATVGCTVDASRSIGGNKEGPVDVTVVVRSMRTESSPLQIDIE